MSLEDMKSACLAIQCRHNSYGVNPLKCFICDNQTVGADAFMAHLIEFHRLRIEHLDNVKDIDAMIKHIRCEVRNDDSDTTCSCLVCGERCDSGAALTQHCTAIDHCAWTRDSVPSLAQYCVVVQSASVPDDDEDAEDNSDNDDEDQEEECEETVCLYCTALCKLSQLEGHLRSAHNLDLLHFVATHRDTIKDEYSLIRMANYVRACSEDFRCPTCSTQHSSREQWSHHIASESHYFPLTVPADDAYLIPRVPGDMLISFLLEYAFDDDDESASYPMVDTVQQLAAKHRQ